ncbi:uncharacterized protein PgNI_07372 [Pyricularia grisea]|uniref:Uncharacterized protein n=1 Tax=Pyricularia grisea TaxID=148305 RepID=A0A6P8B129_PYRGI|nr:uncharacterized protein PgNI_07372 [Pyricularia grisea]TLD08605.1 hypothetical protein PgNI_07372 [Pyricularia grisea]
MFGLKILPVLLVWSVSLSWTAADKIPNVLYRLDFLSPVHLEKWGLTSRGECHGLVDNTITYAEHKDLYSQLEGTDQHHCGGYRKSPFISLSANLRYLLNYRRPDPHKRNDVRYVYHVNTNWRKSNFFDASKLLEGKVDLETLAEVKEFGTKEKIIWKMVMGWNVIREDGSVFYIKKDDWIERPWTQGKILFDSYANQPEISAEKFQSAQRAMGIK